VPLDLRLVPGEFTHDALELTRDETLGVLGAPSVRFGARLSVARRGGGDSCRGGAGRGRVCLGGRRRQGGLGPLDLRVQPGQVGTPLEHGIHAADRDG